MKDKKLYIVAILGFLFLLAAMVGCSKKSPVASPVMGTKSATILMKAKAKTGPQMSLSGIPVPGGDLTIQTAMVNIDHIQIQENSGLNVQQEGNYNNGPDIGGNDNSQAEGPDLQKGTEIDSADILLPGPYALNVTSGQVVVDSAAVYPGTFKQVNLSFLLNTAPPFNGKSIVISGSYAGASGSPVPFTLKSEFTQTIQTKLAGNGVTVTQNAKVPLTIVFDLPAWFANVDFSSATITSGEILIDATHNSALLGTFEKNLAKYIDVEEVHGGSEG